MRAAQRVEKLEARQPDHLTGPWVEFIWERGQPYPVVPPGHNAIINKIVSPGDPPEWLGTADAARESEAGA